MRISDWSSDVCSSDLKAGADQYAFHRLAGRDAPAEPGEDEERQENAARTGVAPGHGAPCQSCPWCSTIHSAPGPPRPSWSTPTSAERRVGEEFVRTFRSRCSPEM